MSPHAYNRLRKPLLWVAFAAAQVSGVPAADLEAGLDAVDSKVIAWRRDFHQHPELSDSEVRTAQIVATHLKKLGLEVTTGVAHHRVVGFLSTGRPGPTIALRADMDALPVSPAAQDLKTVPENHSPLFYIDEKAIPVATRALLAVTVDYLSAAR